MHSKARIGGTQILVKRAMIHVYVYFKILLTCIFLLFILWYTMLKVSLHAEDYYLVIENDNTNFGDIFFLPLLPFFLLCQMLNCSNFKTRLAQVLAKKDHEKHQHAKKCGHPRKGNKKGQCSSTTVPVNKHAVSLKCYYDQKNVNTKVTQVRT